jgi:plastocyanin
MNRLRTAAAVLLLGLVLGACGSASGVDSSATPQAPAGTPASGTITIVAKDMAFTTKTVSVQAGTALTLVFQNQDSMPHNVALYSDGSASKLIAKTDIVSAKSVTIQLPALASGTYFFRCDVHPAMTGTLIAQ